MSEAVLDASALLAALRDQPGAGKVEPYIGEGAINAVNLSEVLAKLIEEGMPPGLARQAVGALGLRVIPFDEELAFRAAALRPATRRLGLAFGDRACLASGIAFGLPVVTADRAWSRLSVGADVRTVR